MHLKTARYLTTLGIYLVTMFGHPDAHLWIRMMRPTRTESAMRTQGPPTTRPTTTSQQRAGEQTTRLDAATSQSRGLAGPLGDARRRSARAVACFIPQEMLWALTAPPRGSERAEGHNARPNPALQPRDRSCADPGSLTPRRPSWNFASQFASPCSHRAADPPTFPGKPGCCRNLRAAALTVAKVQLSSIPQAGTTERRHSPATKISV